VAFLDEDDPFSPDQTEVADRRPGPPDRDRQILVRRLIAVVAGIAIVVLLVLGVKGCLDARKERAFENYSRDLNALASESQQLSAELFDSSNGLFENPGNLTPLEFEAQIKNLRSQAEGLVTRAQGLDAPGELKPAQADLVLAFELRRDGLAAISNEISTAFADEGREEALANIAEDMQYFVASDVLYRRARAEIEDVSADECPKCNDVPESQFLPDITWLDESTVAEALGQVSGQTTKATAGVHGLGLVTGGVTLKPGDVTLTPDGTVTATASDSESLDVQVENQGDSEETGVTVTVEIDGSEAGTGTIDTISAGEIATANVPLDPAPQSGDTADIHVSVEPVLGEQVADNNEADYTVTFE
jgi:hypothetical protein